MDHEKALPYVIKAVGGDTEAFEQIYNFYWRMAYYYCLKYLKNEAEAEEVAQDAFFTLFRHITKLQNPKMFKAYFSKILTSCCHNRSKIRKKTNNDMPLMIDDYRELLQEERIEFLPEVMMDQIENKSELVKAIDELPAKQREVMLLHYLQELSQAEIAAVLNVKPSAVGNRLFHAKAALKKKLDKREEPSTSLASMVPLPVGLLLLNEMAQRTTPEIQARIWDGVQSRIQAYLAPQKSPGSGQTSNLVWVCACVAALCIAVFSINNLWLSRAPGTDTCQAGTYHMLDRFTAITNVGDFNDFVAANNFCRVHAAVWVTHEREVEYRLYQRDYCANQIFVGIRIAQSETAIAYEIVPPGTPPPEDVQAWFSEHPHTTQLPLHTFAMRLYNR